MTRTDIEKAAQREAMLMTAMMMLVLEGSAMRETADDPAAMNLTIQRYPHYKNTALMALVIYTANRFEDLIRQGKKTTDVLKMLRVEGVMDRYDQAFKNPSQEVH